MEHAIAGEQSPAGYPHLVDRAIECVNTHGGALDENALVARVFGNASSAALWRPLLRSVLAGHPQLTLRPDGVWTTAMSAREGAEFPSEFVVLDVETTGLKPSRQRVIEVGMIRVSTDGSPMRWTTLVNPGRPVPAYVASLTGIDDSMLATAPDFRSIAPTIVEIAADLPVVSHNVDFDIAFINAELARCNLPKLVNTPVDTLALANVLVGEARRLSLIDVARALGIASKQTHRAMADAETTLDVFRALLGRARDRGFSTLDDLLRLGAAHRPSSPGRKPVGRGRAILDRSHLAEIPHAPGVYIMRDIDARVLYVGKANDLRKRVASYYSQPLGYTRKMDGLLETLARIDVEVVGSELEALILESQLIRRYRPRFNTAQRNAEQYVYVKVDVTNPWPRVTASKDRADDGAVYFGPFKSGSRAREAVDLVNDILPLRTCRRSFADKRSLGSPCLELSLKRCLGPCVGQADPETYKGMINDVLRFFRGDDSQLVAHLHAKLETTVQTLDFERAVTFRDRLRRVERLAAEQQRIDEAARFRHALLVLRSARQGCREIWYLVAGRRWAQLTVRDDEDVAALSERLAPIAERAAVGLPRHVPDHHSVDELAILARWMRKTPRHPALISLDGGVSLEEVSRAALAVDLAKPFGESAGQPARTNEDDAEYDLSNATSWEAEPAEGSNCDQQGESSDP